MLASLQAGDMKAIKKQAHSVKGTSWMYGFTHLGNLCLDLEKAAEEDAPAPATRLIAEIIDYLDTVQIHYREINDQDN
jgi:HPt (histidine-containing phosphotransfer) domain-containing protein